MSLPSELERLVALHASGKLSNDEFSAAKAALLSAGTSGQAGDIRDQPRSAVADEDDKRRIDNPQLEELKRANAIAELDREWALKRESFMMTGQHEGGYPYRYRPTRGGSIVGGVVILIFGVFWTKMAASVSSVASHVIPLLPMGGGAMDRSFSLFPMFGVLFILFGLWVSYQGYTRADALESAEKDYHRRRAALLAGQNDTGASMSGGRSTEVANEIDEDTAS